MSESTKVRVVAWILLVSAFTAEFWHSRPDEVRVDIVVIIASMLICTSIVLKALGK